MGDKDQRLKTDDGKTEAQRKTEEYQKHGEEADRDSKPVHTQRYEMQEGHEEAQTDSQDVDKKTSEEPKVEKLVETEEQKLGIIDKIKGEKEAKPTGAAATTLSAITLGAVALFIS